MIYVTEIQGRVIDFLKNNPDSSLLTISVGVGKKSKILGSVISHMFKAKLLTRTGIEKQYRYRFAGMPYKVGTKPLEIKPVEKEDDNLLVNLSKTDLSQEKLQLLKDNIRLPRNKLAKLLGISKLELNQAMDKYGIRSKYKPKHIDMSEDE